MTSRFAAETSVSIDRSIAEIRATVRRYGAVEFAHMEADSRAAIAFTMKGRRIRLTLEMPDPKTAPSPTPRRSARPGPPPAPARHGSRHAGLGGGRWPLSSRRSWRPSRSAS